MIENREFRAVELMQETCIRCGCTFWITKAHRDNLIQTKNDFYCPNGHSQCYRGEDYKTTISHLKNNISTCQNIRKEKEKQIDKLEKSVRAYKMLFAREKKKQR